MTICQRMTWGMTIMMFKNQNAQVVALNANANESVGGNMKNNGNDQASVSTHGAPDVGDMKKIALFMDNLLYI